MKAVKGKLPEERVPIFEKGAAAYAKKIVANFKDFEFVSIGCRQWYTSYVLTGS